MENGVPVEGSLFIYAPNKGAPVFFAIMFAALGAGHLWQCYHFNCLRFTIIFPLCCFMFAAGFALREYGAFNYTVLRVYLTSTIFIYFGPPLLELQNYHILGRILYYVPWNAPIHPGRVFTTFAILSIIVEVLNAIGVTYVTNPTLGQNYANTGEALMKTSLALQIVVVGLFYLLAGSFHVRCVRAGIRSRKIAGPLVTLYISSFLIFIRTIYRMVEYFGFTAPRPGTGLDLTTLSPILRYEWFFYVFEASPMLANVALWCWRHPRRYLPESHRIYLSKDGVTEIEGPGWDDNRAFLVTALDPFGLWGTRRTEKKLPFWETHEPGGANANVVETQE